MEEEQKTDEINKEVDEIDKEKIGQNNADLEEPLSEAEEAELNAISEPEPEKKDIEDVPTKIRKRAIATDLPMKSVIECLLFVSDVPLSPKKLSALTAYPENEIKEVLKALIVEHENMGHSYKITEIAQGFTMCTRQEYAPWVKLLYAARNRAKLSKASLEVAAILAYRQPLTKAEIEAIRGVDCTGVIQNLMEKKLIKISGRKKVLGRPLLYRTTDEFLMYFGLKDLTELPRIEELRGIIEGQNTKG